MTTKVKKIQKLASVDKVNSKPSRLDNVLKRFLINQPSSKDGKQTDTTESGKIVKDD